MTQFKALSPPPPPQKKVVNSHLQNLLMCARDAEAINQSIVQIEPESQDRHIS